MAHLTTHVLDASLGRPADGIAVTLADSTGTAISEKKTDNDGRISDFGAELPVGIYRLTFDTASYFAAQQVCAFYPEVIVTFEITDSSSKCPNSSKYHVPLLLSPYSYSTYRGS